MIYEKRKGAAHGVKRADLAIGDYMPENILTRKRDYTEPSFSLERRSRGGSKKSKRKVRLLTAVCLAVCLFLLDAKFLDSYAAERLFGAVKMSANKIVRHIRAQNDVTQSPDDYGRTLYSLSYAPQNVQTTTPSAAQVQTEVLAEDEAEPVDSITEQSYADGERLYPIVSLDLSADSLYSLNNATSFSPQVELIAEAEPSALKNINIDEGPLVLILHTHGTESYTKNSDMYPEGEQTRSRDIQSNVVRVGEEIAKTLSEFGVDTIHCSTMHDKDSFINAYTSSAKTVKKYLEEYPSIKFVIDVHRDAIIRDDGESVRAVVNIAGEDYAQIMFVVGTNELGHNHPAWQENLSLALRLQEEIGETYPSLCRSINLRNVPFNQQLSNGYLLLEVGTCANTLTEALRSARAFGENLARVIMRA